MICGLVTATSEKRRRLQTVKSAFVFF